MKRILIVTDTWENNTNGVVTSYKNVINLLQQMPYTVYVISPKLFYTVPCPTYPEIRLAIPFGIGKLIKNWGPDYIHIATEGPLGLSARNYCVKNKIKFTTAYHTNFPEYINKKTKLPVKWLYSYFRWFHNSSSVVMCATDSLMGKLKNYGFISPLKKWGRGIDVTKFFPMKDSEKTYNFLYCGRVSIEKNLLPFFKVFQNFPNIKKIVVGDGPLLLKYKKQFPEVTFVGKITDKDRLRELYNSVSVFVFPSLTDTFGLVMIEANACGLPVAAFPVDGPKDIIINGKNGYLSWDLEEAILKCLNIRPESCIVKSRDWNWITSAEQFRKNLVAVKG